MSEVTEVEILHEEFWKFQGNKRFNIEVTKDFLTNYGLCRRHVESVAKELEKIAIEVEKERCVCCQENHDVEYGCYCDLGPNEKPDNYCVLDTGEIEHCIYAPNLHKESKPKEACHYWQPIENDTRKN